MLIRVYSCIFVFKNYCLTFKAMKKETIKFVIQLVISILTAIATTLGVTSCM